MADIFSSGERRNPRRRWPRSRLRHRGDPERYDAPLIALVVARPGITVAQAAQEIGVDATALYPVIRRLEQHGRLRKLGASSTRRADRDSRVMSALLIAGVRRAGRGSFFAEAAELEGGELVELHVARLVLGRAPHANAHLGLSDARRFAEERSGVTPRARPRSSTICSVG